MLAFIPIKKYLNITFPHFADRIQRESCNGSLFALHLPAKASGVKSFVSYSLIMDKKQVSVTYCN